MFAGTLARAKTGRSRADLSINRNSECRSLVRTSGQACAVFCVSKGGDPAAPSDTATLLRLHPSQNHSVVTVLPKVRLATSGATHSHGVTGGVYKARERIHRSNADLRLLAIPTSWSRVADSNPD